MSTFDAAREHARQDNGRFGTRPSAEAQVDLTTYQATPAAAYRANRKAAVDAVADYDNDPSETNFWQVKTAALALESSLTDTDIPNSTWDELRHARQRAKNSVAGTKRLRSAIDNVSGWGDAVYGN